MPPQPDRFPLHLEVPPPGDRLPVGARVLLLERRPPWRRRVAVLVSEVVEAGDEGLERPSDAAERRRPLLAELPFEAAVRRDAVAIHPANCTRRSIALSGARLSDRKNGMSDAPKSALELVMERLRRKDADSGVVEQPLTDAQRAAIAEARSVYEARVAERRIMHASAIAGVIDPEARAALEQELRRDLDRFESDREARIRRIRAGDPQHEG